ncbi:conserved hypothetical protein [Leishmania infantum JPCM5]|uniref:Uncharacterized protein n=2 Tax=Leishmania infantum TaxID=5671 RepID=A4HTD7_LEIIN|nr:conserved hypothetical protein [Leishmania infantum JPCM5]CAC9449867.1 hypothetical_protein_-_conserved [Leishmania infantum]CAM65686.1 conserved hypothetical protein [Leishmania infantum JPCM5]SUZ39310.1 hypothetical_protein_-_conserved [Leishmania infantum]|eukprot:XP_001463328.1 conserved hypothetical protein [Leishmania infantum JPCM5]
MSLKHVASFGAVGVLSVVGVLGGTRWRRVELRRAELNEEYTKLMTEMRTFNEERLTRDGRLAAKEVEAKATAETVDILWSDRLARYAEVNKDLHAYLAALPEAIGALKGLSNHYRYMSEEMTKFMGFDIACSKMHNLALMLEHGKAVGIERVAAAVQEMFAAEPLVQTVCTSILAAPAPPHPSSIAAASATFTFCMEELDRAVGKVAMRYAAALEELPNATPGILSDSVRKLVGMTRADTLSKGQRQLAERRRDLERMLRRAQRQLHTEEDIRAALDYTRELDQHLQAAAPKRTDLLLSLPSRKDNFLAAVRSDSEVKKAIQQINLWRDSATTFLVHRQAEDALQSYYLLLAETLTAVNELK